MGLRPVVFVPRTLVRTWGTRLSIRQLVQPKIVATRAKLLCISAVAVRGADGCPTFAPANVGRKRRGEAPSTLLESFKRLSTMRQSSLGLARQSGNNEGLTTANLPAYPPTHAAKDSNEYSRASPSGCLL